MDPEIIFQQMVKELGIEGMSEADQEEILRAMATAIQKQFLLDIYDKIGKDQFDAIEASIKMGEDFYATTLKHMVPDYEEMFQASRKKVMDAYKNAKPEENTAVVQ